MATERPDAAVPSTPAAASAVAQSRTDDAPTVGASSGVPQCDGKGIDFELGSGVVRGIQARPYERRPEDPLYRPLWIYTLDPAASRTEGAVAVINVPYEPLDPGPVGRMFEVDPRDQATGERFRQLEPDSVDVLIRNGRPPSPADPRFHQQMVYAVCSAVYAAFRTAVGRQVAWGFDRQDPAGTDDGAAARLVLRPHGGGHTNAWYDPRQGTLQFGYYHAGDEVSGRNVPGGFVFTALSHDIVAHEVTHALLDGLRARFNIPTGPDVLGFHEGFADIVAIFQRFSYPDVVRSAIRNSRGLLSHAEVLTGLARQFGHTTGSGRPLRTAIDIDAQGNIEPRPYQANAEEHDMGSVLVSAVFDAFLTLYGRKTERYVRLATGGTGNLPPGELSADLQTVLAAEASQLASQFLSICIRAIDYCPPVDLELGEFLRAVITADYDLVPDDPWGYREAWIEAFGRHRIYPPQVRSLAEDELRWKPPVPTIDQVEPLGFDQLRFRGDPACAAGPDELRRQACALGAMLAGHLDQFGVARRGDPALDGDEVDLPCIESIRSSRRIGPDRQVIFDLVAEVTQRRVVRRDGDHFEMYGGATVILGPRGEVRYVVAKNVRNNGRLERQRSYVRGRGSAYWTPGARGWMVPRDGIFRRLHGAPDAA